MLAKDLSDADEFASVRALTTRPTLLAQPTLESGGTPYAGDAYDVLLDDGSLLRIVYEDGAWFARGVFD